MFEQGLEKLVDKGSLTRPTTKEGYAFCVRSQPGQHAAEIALHEIFLLSTIVFQHLNHFVDGCSKVGPFKDKGTHVSL